MSAVPAALRRLAGRIACTADDCDHDPTQRDMRCGHCRDGEALAQFRAVTRTPGRTDWRQVADMLMQRAWFYTCPTHGLTVRGRRQGDPDCPFCDDVAAVRRVVSRYRLDPPPEPAGVVVPAHLVPYTTRTAH